jgi:hypothetical protein
MLLNDLIRFPLILKATTQSWRLSVPVAKVPQRMQYMYTRNTDNY